MRDDTQIAQVESLPNSMLTLPDEEQAVVQQILRDLETLQTALGAERERHHLEIQRLERAADHERARAKTEETRILHALASARRKYNQLVDVLATKYVRRPGSFSFRPEIGAFVETRRSGSES